MELQEYETRELQAIPHDCIDHCQYLTTTLIVMAETTARARKHLWTRRLGKLNVCLDVSSTLETTAVDRIAQKVDFRLLGCHADFGFQIEFRKRDHGSNICRCIIDKCYRRIKRVTFTFRTKAQVCHPVQCRRRLRLHGSSACRGLSF